MADEQLQAFKEAIEEDTRLKRKILDVLEQARLDQETLEHLCDRQKWTEKILNAQYLILCNLQEMQVAQLSILGKRLRKDSDKLDILQEELRKRLLENGFHDLMEISAGGDVSVDQSRKKVVDDEKGED